MLTLLEIITTAIWLMLPAYVPNTCAALVGGGTAIDFGKTFRDGRRILGDGKTYRGFVLGVLTGVVVGIGQNLVAPDIEYPVFATSALIFLPLGAMIGDLVKSFLKRRAGFEQGAPLPLIDQLDLVLGAWAFTYVFSHEWFVTNFTLWVMILVIIITPVLHIIVNIIGYKLGKKDVPW
ncbi:MAG: CDP-2,3-bis-(O-geranylgeranyl)-sn-glycerol synthase [Methanocellales archaeon]|nr:CDP-2,3-bis-(O-geranylgeranyl)-sn-glycerol synthase [Methanocellales archaeon]